MVPPTRGCAVAARPPGRNAVVAPTEHVRCRGAGSVAEHSRCAANIHVRRRGAVSGAERHRGAAQTPWNVCASHAMVFPPGQYSRHHGGVCTWRSANRDTSCRGAVSSAVLTASRVVGGPHRLARPPGSMAGHRRGAFAVDVRRRGATSRARHHRHTAQTAKRQCAATTMAEHHPGAADSQVRRHGATSRAARRHGDAQTTVRRQGAGTRPAPTEPGGT